MPAHFRYSPNPNRASEIRWRPWGRDAFDEAAAADAPVLLALTAIWCRWCHRMDETTFSEPDLIELVNERLIPIRVDADLHPHVQERYLAAGWPTNAFLTPTGEVLWSGTYVPPEEFRSVAAGVLAAWRGRREELEVEIARRRKALEAARSRRHVSGLVRREAATEVLDSIRAGFDLYNGGFGSEPKFPDGALLELLFAHGHRAGGAAWRAMAERMLDGILAGELRDPVEDGFFRYALAADWTSPQREKLLDTNAGLLTAFALGCELHPVRTDWRGAAEGIVSWVESRLALPNGLWGASECAPDGYYDLDAAERRRRGTPFVDPIIYAAPNARWVAALADAGGRLGRADWIARAREALGTLLDVLAAPGDLLHHARLPGGEALLPGLLDDSVATARAALAVAQATGEEAPLAHARRLLAGAQAALWADDGGFWDHVRTVDDVGALRYRERPFHGNAAAVRLLLELSFATGDRGYRAMAERILALLSPVAERYGPDAAPLALAVEAFFAPPVRIFLVGSPEASAELRRAALSLPDPERLVWTLPRGGRLGTLFFDPRHAPAAFVCGARDCSPPVREPGRLAEIAHAAH